MSFHVIRFDDLLPQPWKNGMGTTREVARFPADAGSDDFLWRVSIADVDSATPFSTFAGIDRHIALLDGDGFTMTLDGERTHALVTPFAPFAFRGEARVDVSMTGGATRDFNLMVRRAWGLGEVRVYTQPGHYEPEAFAVLLHVARGSVITIDGTLQTGDTWLPDRSPFELAADSVVLLAIAAPNINTL